MIQREHTECNSFRVRGNFTPSSFNDFVAAELRLPCGATRDHPLRSRATARGTRALRNAVTLCVCVVRRRSTSLRSGRNCGMRIEEKTHDSHKFRLLGSLCPARVFFCEKQKKPRTPLRQTKLPKHLVNILTTSHSGTGSQLIVGSEHAVRARETPPHRSC